MIKQINNKNVGVDVNGDIPMGYQHTDGLAFNENWIAQKDFNVLAKDILNNYPDTKKILDVGSGAGNLRHALININSDLLIVTLDGNKETINSPFINKNTHFLLRTDVDYELVENNKTILFDIICSFEHFEHIEPNTFNIFIANLKKHSHNNTILIASAANWEYPNNNIHCNVKSIELWDNELTNKYGMIKIKSKILNDINWSSRIKFTHELHYKINQK